MHVLWLHYRHCLRCHAFHPAHWSVFGLKTPTTINRQSNRHSQSLIILVMIDYNFAKLIPRLVYSDLHNYLCSPPPFNSYSYCWLPAVSSVPYFLKFHFSVPLSPPPPELCFIHCHHPYIFPIYSLISYIQFPSLWVWWIWFTVYGKHNYMAY